MSLTLQKRRRLPLLGGVVALLMAGVLVTYGAYGLWKWRSATSGPPPVVSSEVVTVSTETPDETPPTGTCESQGMTALQPQRVAIDSINVDGCIERVGIDQHGAIAVPTNIYFAGWYVNSALPGEEGLSIIDGHVLGRYNDAIFAHLAEVEPSTSIQITRADGEIREFSVVDVRTFSEAETSKHLFEKLPDVESQLTLITCGGTYDRGANTYDKRVIVRAALKRE